MPSAAATASTDLDQVPLSEIKESLLDRSAKNANQVCFDACASMNKKDERWYSERVKISSKKHKGKQKKNRTKILAIDVDKSIIGQQTLSLIHI